MQRVHGNLTGLKHDQLRRVERIGRRRCPPELIVGPELARYMSEVSREIGRQIGVLINRRGQVRGRSHGVARDSLRSMALTTSHHPASGAAWPKLPTP